jgi:hypothetical protein
MKYFIYKNDMYDGECDIAELLISVARTSSPDAASLVADWISIGCTPPVLRLPNKHSVHCVADGNFTQALCVTMEGSNHTEIIESCDIINVDEWYDPINGAYILHINVDGIATPFILGNMYCIESIVDRGYETLSSEFKHCLIKQCGDDYYFMICDRIERKGQSRFIRPSHKRVTILTPIDTDLSDRLNIPFWCKMLSRGNRNRYTMFRAQMIFSALYGLKNISNDNDKMLSMRGDTMGVLLKPGSRYWTLIFTGPITDPKFGRIVEFDIDDNTMLQHLVYDKVVVYKECLIAAYDHIKYLESVSTDGETNKEE